MTKSCTIVVCRARLRRQGREVNNPRRRRRCVGLSAPRGEGDRGKCAERGIESSYLSNKHVELQWGELNSPHCATHWSAQLRRSERH